MLNQDYKDILQSLSDLDAQFIIVGAYALAVHGFPRATGDIDIFVKASSENSKKVFQALKSFGAPTHEIDETSFNEAGIIFQIGVIPQRIDIITTIDGVEFDEAWTNRKIIELEGIKISVLSKKDMLKNKKATDRDKDRTDIKILES